MNKLITAASVMILLIAGVVYFNRNKPEAPVGGSERIENEVNGKALSIVADNLNIPWSIVFLPDGDMLVTERPGNITRIKSDGGKESIDKIDEVEHVGEGGLLGMEIHPDFLLNNFLYVYYTYSAEGNRTLNRVVRYKLTGNSLTEKQVIVDAIPGAANHNGGRIKFGPDRNLYIATGDAQEPSLAQNKDSLAGKILRVTDTGDPAAGNPFGNRTYSYGHRNVQGLAWDEGGKLWATEHGRSGVRSGLDEINLIEPGINYGWPDIEGDAARDGMQAPVRHSGGNATWAPAGAVFYQGSYYFAGLRGTTLYQAVIKNNKVTEVKEHFKGQFGRLRDIVLYEGAFYVTTSNRDGRGQIRERDDKIIRIDPESLR